MLEHLSFSSINTYLLCPRAWRHRYVDKTPAPTSGALIIGNAFHDAIEAHLKAGTPLEEGLRVSWPALLERNPEIDWGDSSQAEAEATLKRMVRAAPVQNLVTKIKGNFDPKTCEMEKRVELQVPGVPVPIIGYIDIITRDGIPGDFKTASRMWQEGKAEDEMQPLVYLAALSQMGIVVPEWKFRHYVFTKTTHPTAKDFESPRKPIEIFWLFEQIRSVWHAIGVEAFGPRCDTWKCSPKYCEYWGECRGKYS